MRAILFSVFVAAGLYGTAQTRCAFTQYNADLVARRPAHTSTDAALNTSMSQTTIGSGSGEGASIASTTPLIRIPVVVHILYNTSAQNIPDADVVSGIAALNRDFRRRNSDTVMTPERFRSRAADTEIEFVLATVDPRGRATKGIERRQSATTDWKMDDKIKATSGGGLDAWDSKSYLNIWIGPMRNLLGFASAPGGPAEWDGIVINTTSFGTLSTGAPYNMGRTAVHEVGHWLGLKHIWGDTYCGDDGIADTPPQGNFTSGCPQAFRSSCSNGADGDMYMNFMDFTNDACMNLFTEGQKQRMRALFFNNGPRSGLLASRGLSLPWTEEITLPEATPVNNATSFQLYPNPSSSFVVVDLSFDPAWLGSNLAIVNAEGRAVKTISLTTRTVRISIADLKAGMYILQARKGQQVITTKLVKL
jgi:hypothetical protein